MEEQDFHVFSEEPSLAWHPLLFCLLPLVPVAKIMTTEGGVKK